MAAAATPPDPALLRLRHGEFLRLGAAEGRTVAVFQGQLWITQDGEGRDTFVGHGETFSSFRPGPAMLHALEPSSLLVLDAPPPVAPRAAWFERLLRRTQRGLSTLPARKEAPCP